MLCRHWLTSVAQSKHSRLIFFTCYCSITMIWKKFIGLNLFYFRLFCFLKNLVLVTYKIVTKNVPTRVQTGATRESWCTFHCHMVGNGLVKVEVSTFSLLIPTSFVLLRWDGDQYCGECFWTTRLLFWYWRRQLVLLYFSGWQTRLQPSWVSQIREQRSSLVEILISTTDLHSL